MSYTIEPSENSKYIICRIGGTLTMDVVLDFTKEMDRVSRESHIKRFLFDVRDATNTLSVLEKYDYAYTDMRALNLQRDIRSAILVSSSDTSHDFVATVAQNAGYNVRVFCDEGEAVGWLDE